MNKIHRIKTDEELNKVLEARKNDSHNNEFYTSHYMEKSGEIVGSFSLLAPMVGWWTHTEKTNKRDNIYMLNAVDVLMSHSGYQTYFIPCDAESPLLPYLNRIATKMNVEFFLKE